MPRERGIRRQPQPRKRDVELAKIERSTEIWTIVAYGVVVALTLAALAIPLLALRSVITPLAGKTTKIEANIVVSVTLGLSIAINGLQWVKSQSHKRELQRQRRRLRELESRVPNMKDLEP
jgi:hypothetical protein